MKIQTVIVIATTRALAPITIRAICHHPDRLGRIQTVGSEERLL